MSHTPHDAADLPPAGWHEKRPDPERLLAGLRQEQAENKRGKLKIFFGACAGVGKTCAMLEAARQRQAEGVEVAIGWIETHGRAHTASLLQDLPQIARKRCLWRERELEEFDLDATLARKPQLVVVDELAHSNLPGSRHAKRWQDVHELLANGIDVYSALNVQHLESLNDVVGAITGVRVQETVPDQVFDQADEISLIDLPPDELLERLRDGKVYLGEQAGRAARNFFRKGNLIALRELALRRSADRVDAQMRAWRDARTPQQVWHAKPRLLVCIGPGSNGEKLVRSAARLAAEWRADWIALYVETPGLQSLAAHERQTVFDHLALAQKLGGESVSIAGDNLAQCLVDFARSRNANRLLLGRNAVRSPWRRWRPRLADALAQRAPDLDLHLVGLDAPHSAPQKAHSPFMWRGHLYSLLACALTTLLATPLHGVFEPANLVMLYLLTVVGIALRFGRWPGVSAAGFAVLFFDFFFVPPRFSFAVMDVQYLFTFGLMLSVALLIGQLAARLRFAAHISQLRERRAQAIAALSKELSGALLLEQVVEIGCRHLCGAFEAQAALLLPDADERLQLAGASTPPPALDWDVAQWSFQHQQAAGAGSATLSAAQARYLPLQAPMRTRGVLAMLSPLPFSQPEERRQLDSFVAQIALAIERVHYVEVAQDALVSMEGERMRNSLLSALSHDLRTPLTALVGLSSTLAARELRPELQRELAQAIQQQAGQMNELVSNLLEMARLQAHGVTLKKDWQSIEEIIGSSLNQLRYDSHRLELQIPPDLPLCECDPVLLQRVLVNLLGNALKHTPPGSLICISASAQEQLMRLEVSDNGPGLPPGQEARLFEKFERGETESNKPGVGLGLALCKAIVEAHGGSIQAGQATLGGASFVCLLPLGTPPDTEELL